MATTTNAALTTCTITSGSIGRERRCGKPAVAWYSERRPELAQNGVTYSCCTKHAPRTTDGTITPQHAARFAGLQHTLDRQAALAAR